MKYFCRYSILFFLVLVISINAQKGCFGSECVPLKDCESLHLLVRAASETKLPRLLQLSRDVHCGFDKLMEPMVCCPKSFREVKDEVEEHPNVALLPQDCGDMGGHRIIGGRVPRLYQFPWMTLISYNTSGGLQFKCGGSVINSKYILTAAHCVDSSDEIAGVRVGEFDVSSRHDCQGDLLNYICESHLQDILVDKVIPHREFGGVPPEQYDIALIRLQVPIDFSFKNAAPICLPVTKKLRSADLAGRQGTVAGWGVTESGTQSNLLLKVDIPIRTGEDCYEYNTNSSILCAGEYTKDSCYGDSGGPLMLEDEYDGAIRIVQYGIVSSGPRLCGSTTPGIYTNVAKFVKWILDNIEP